MSTNNYPSKMEYSRAIYEKYKNMTLIEIIKNHKRDRIPFRIISDAILYIHDNNRKEKGE